MRLPVVCIAALGCLTASAMPIGLRMATWDAMLGESDAGYLSLSASELLNATNQTFTTGGDSTWYAANVSHDGVGSLRSGRISNGESSWIETTVNLEGRISFWWKASCEEYDSDIYDYAYLSIDGVPQGVLNNYQLEGISIGGQTDWTNVVFDVTGEGTHTIRWTYCKDNWDDPTSNIGEDCVWLDEFSFTPKPTISFDIGANANGNAPDSIHAFAEAHITLPNQIGFDWPDHVFRGWTDGISQYAAGANYTVPSSNVTLSAIWIAKSFVSFDIGGGNGTTPEMIKALPDETITLPTDGGFAWTDHVFDGWSDGTNDYAEGADYTVPSSNVTLTAKWIVKSFVSFDIGNGTGTAPETIKDVPNAVVTLPMADGIEWIDHVFNGWSDGESVYPTGADYTVPTSNITLTAQWIAKSFISFDIGDGTGETPQTIKALPDEIISLPTGEGLTLTDYAFGGWTDGAVDFSAGDDYSVPSSNVVLSARWIAKRFLTFTLDGGEGEIPITIKDIPNATVTLPSGDGLNKAKHTFIGWSDGAQTYEAGAEYVVTDTSVEFTAVWAANTLAAPVITSADVANGGTIETESATIEIMAEDGTAIYYTTDGTEPTTNSTLYAAPFTADGMSVTIKAFAVKDDYFDSEVAEFAFTRKPYSEAECLNADGKTISTGGTDAAWMRVLGDSAHDGVAALRSGAIGDGETSTVEMTVEGAGQIAFWWKVSSEINHNRKFDYVSFSIDGVEQNWIGGEVDWSRASFTISERGTHTLKWVYQKNTNGLTQGDDCAWLDGVTWTPQSWFVVFHTNGGHGGLFNGTGQVNYVHVEDGMTLASTINDLPEAERPGYRFLGWFTAADGGTQIDKNIVIDSAKTFFAHWESTDEGIIANGVRWFCNEREDLGGVEITGIDNATIPKNLMIPSELAGAKVVAIGAYAFSTYHSDFEYMAITNVVLNNGLIVLACGAFEGCNNLASVTMADGIREIQGYVFADCFSLASINIAEGVSSLNECCFAGCGYLSSVVLPSTITNLERTVFQECCALQEVIFKGGKPSVSGSTSAEGDSDGLFHGDSDSISWQADPTIYVMDGTGWKDEQGNLITTWHDKLVVLMPFPYLGDEPTAEDMAEVFAYSADERLTAHIKTGSEYKAYLAWLERVCGYDPSKRYMAEYSSHAWLSFALDANALIINPPKQGDLKIDEFKPSATSGAFDFDVSIENITVGEGATATNLAEIFGIEGATTPNGDYSSSGVELSFGTPAEGKVRCTARPKDSTAKSFFMKVRMTP